MTTKSISLDTLDTLNRNLSAIAATADALALASEDIEPTSIRNLANQIEQLAHAAQDAIDNGKAEQGRGVEPHSAERRALSYALHAQLTAFGRVEQFMEYLNKEVMPSLEARADMLFDSTEVALKGGMEALRFVTDHVIGDDGPGLNGVDWNAPLRTFSKWSGPSVSEVIEAVEGKPEDEAA